MRSRTSTRWSRHCSPGLRIVLLIVVGVPLVGLFLLSPALGAALSAAGTLVALVLALADQGT